MKKTIPQTTTANTEREQRLKVHLRLLTQKGAVLGRIMRVKALIAYYKGIPVDVIAACYDVTPKSVQQWVKRFESEGEEGRATDRVADDRCDCRRSKRRN